MIRGPLECTQDESRSSPSARRIAGWLPAAVSACPRHGGPGDCPGHGDATGRVHFRRAGGDRRRRPRRDPGRGPADGNGSVAWPGGRLRAANDPRPGRRDPARPQGLRAAARRRRVPPQRRHFPQCAESVRRTRRQPVARPHRGRARPDVRAVWQRRDGWRPADADVGAPLRRQRVAGTRAAAIDVRQRRRLDAVPGRGRPSGASDSSSVAARRTRT